MVLFCNNFGAWKGKLWSRKDTYKYGITSLYFCYLFSSCKRLFFRFAHSFDSGIIYSEERGNNDAWFCGANLQSELLYSKIGPSKYFSRVLKRPMNFMFLCCVPLNSNRFGCKRFPKNSKVVKWCAHLHYRAVHAASWWLLVRPACLQVVFCCLNCCDFSTKLPVEKWLVVVGHNLHFCY